MRLPVLVVPSQAYLQQRLDYDPETGVFLWRIRPVSDFKPDTANTAEALHKRWSSRYAGKEAGCPTQGRNKSRRAIGIDGVKYAASRIAIKWMTGADPDFVDHRDMDTSNNRWINLRVCSDSENKCNQRARPKNVSRMKGVWSIRSTGRFQAHIAKNNIRHYLGTFDTPELAHEAYCKAAAELHGNFARTK